MCARPALIEQLERRRLLAVALNVNFQPAGASVPAGYVADTGSVYANRGNGNTYGWNASASTATRDRNSSASPDQRYDTLVHTQMFGARTWEASVPNGTYNVRIVAGDPSYTDSTIAFNAENVLVASGALSSSKHFIDATKTITVSDGKLTISNAAGSSNNKLCFVQITSVGASVGSLSIAATDANAAEAGANTGTFKVTRTGATTSALSVKYLITGSATNGTDYNTLSGTVTIAAGATSANITVTPKTDGVFEGTESVILTLQNAGGLTLDSSTATVNIADADVPVSGEGWPASFSSGPDAPKRHWESASVAFEGKIYIFGGWMSGSSTATQQVDMYDPAANKWTTLGYMPVPHTHAGLAVDAANRTFYFAGGLYGSFPGTVTNKVFKYDVATNKYSEMDPMPSNHEGGALVFLNNKLHWIGGAGDERSVNVADHLVLDLGNQAAGWTSAAPMPDARDHFAHVVLDGKIIAIGGEFGHDKFHIQQNLVDSYDPATDTWTRLASIPQARSHNESSTYVAPNGHIISAGGQIDNYKQTADVIDYDPATKKWTTIGKLPKPLMGPVVQQIGNKIIIATGNDGVGPITTTWIGELS